MVGQASNPILVGFIRGWKIYERNVPEGTNTVSVTNAEQLFTLLEKGRIDVALYTRIMGLDIIYQRQIEGVKQSGAALATKEMFMYLHNGHSELVAGIAAALADIKTEGIYVKALNSLESKYLEID